MSNQNYSLDIISHHPKFDCKNLRKYYVEGIETVGAWGDEPFEIKFKNNTWQKVQVKLSVDGTDILSGDKATTDVDKNMWVVNGYGTLSLRCWPETNNGGAVFIFTSANNSVAANVHGDLTNRGIIVAAVYVEGHVEPIRFTAPIVIDHHHYYNAPRRDIYWEGPVWVGGGYFNGGVITNSIFNNSNIGSSTNDCVYSANTSSSKASYNSLELSDVDTGKNLESLVAVGAGQHIDQKITYVTGLIKPTFTETVRVRYMWWDELQAKLREYNVPAPHASGFPGDKVKNIDLKGTPRMGTQVRRNYQQDQAYSRI
jgi:hypothetical protein